jgi:hypothetical protein
VKRILDHPAIIFVNICEIFVQKFDDIYLYLNERQLRKLIWIPKIYIENQETLNYIPNIINHMKYDIITWHRQFYDIAKPYTPKQDIDSSDEESDEESEFPKIEEYRYLNDSLF